MLDIGGVLGLAQRSTYQTSTHLDTSPPLIPTPRVRGFLHHHQEGRPALIESREQKNTKAPSLVLMMGAAHLHEVPCGAGLTHARRCRTLHPLRALITRGAVGDHPRQGPAPAAASPLGMVVVPHRTGAM